MSTQSTAAITATSLAALIIAGVAYFGGSSSDAPSDAQLTPPPIMQTMDVLSDGTAPAYAWIPPGARGTVTCSNPLEIDAVQIDDPGSTADPAGNTQTLVTIAARNTSDQPGSWTCTVTFTAPPADAGVAAP